MGSAASVKERREEVSAHLIPLYSRCATGETPRGKTAEPPTADKAQAAEAPAAEATEAPAAEGASAGAAVPPELRARFEAAGQGHVFRFLDEGKVPEGQQAPFLAQLEAMDLEYIERSYRGAMADAAKTKEAATSGSAGLDPPDSCACLADCAKEDIDAWEKAGLEAVGRGEVAACMLAGGQGTRLGFDGPKGCYKVGLESGKSLFQVCAERIHHLTELGKSAGGAASRIPYLVMTSPLNHEATCSFFKDNGYFGLSEDDVWFFVQGTLPCLTRDGKIILESAGSVAAAPDGNGGFYPALQKSGCLARLQEAGVKYIHVFSVDNLLCRPADPRFVGYCAKRGADCGNKCVWKANPEEKIGVVGKKDGRPMVVEYSELDEANKNLRDAGGRLVYGAGNICNHLFSVAFLAETVLANMSNLFHLAHKKIPCAGDDGETVKPETENGIKLEAFIFDVFPLSKEMAILETSREEEFSPVKNPPGVDVDSPDTAKAMLNALSRRWVKEAGGTVEGPEDAILEISPLLSYNGEGLKERVGGQTVTAPCYLEP